MPVVFDMRCLTDRRWLESLVGAMQVCESETRFDVIGSCRNYLLRARTTLA